MSTSAKTPHHASRPPADTDPGPIQLRPRRSRRICLATIPIVLNVFAVCGVSLNPAVVGLTGRISLFAVAAVAAVILYALQARPLIVAGPQTIRVRNLLDSKAIHWDQVGAIVYTGQKPWPHMQLRDGSTVALQAIQRWDRDHAVTATQTLRTLHTNATDVLDEP